MCPIRYRVSLLTFRARGNKLYPMCDVPVCSLSEHREIKLCPMCDCVRLTGYGKASCPMCKRVRQTGHGKASCPTCDRVSLLTVRSRKNKLCPIRDCVRLAGEGKQAQCVRYVTVSDWWGTRKQAVSDT